MVRRKWLLTTFTELAEVVDVFALTDGRVFLYSNLPGPDLVVAARHTQGAQLQVVDGDPARTKRPSPTAPIVGSAQSLTQEDWNIRELETHVSFRRDFYLCIIALKVLSKLLYPF